MATPARIEILELIGQGSSGCVYRAVRTDPTGTIKQPVALKILNSKNLVKIWRKEFDSLVKVNSRHCVRIYGYEWIHEKPALMLELVRGVTLTELRISHSLSDEEIRHILSETRRGLEDLAAAGLCHGDLSPSNIMIDENGRIRLCDYGLGNIDRQHRRLTPRYAAPEALKSGASGLSSDLWSLGRIISECCHPASELKEDPAVVLLNSECAEIRTEAPFPNYDADRACAGLSRRVVALLLERSRGTNRTQDWKVASVWAKDSTKRNIRARKLTGILATTALSFVLGGSGLLHSSLGAEGEASLRFRSNFAVSVSVDGQPEVSAPFDLPNLSPGTHRIRWNGPRGRGERLLTLKAGEHKVIDDREFSHP